MVSIHLKQIEFLFQNQPNMYGVAGISLIAVVLLSSVLKKIVEEKLPPDHYLRKSKWKHVLL